MGGDGKTKYPRRLRQKELDILLFVLPEDRPGYNAYREFIVAMVVLAAGRRGAGNFILGFDGDKADLVSPLTPVVAYGVVETTMSDFSVTVREVVGDQIDVEIVGTHGEEIPDHYEEKRRWTYSTWKPGEPSPDTGTAVREVNIQNGMVLVFSTNEKRIWLHDGLTGMNHLIPVTHYRDELKRLKGIRDPKVALKYDTFFDEQHLWLDDDMRMAFVAYNKLHPRVTLVLIGQPEPTMTGVMGILRRIFGRKV